MDNGAQFSDGLTAKINLVNAKREPRWKIKGYPSIDGSQQLLFHGGAGKILDLSDDIVEDDISILYSTLRKYYEVENELRKSRSSRSRSSAFRKTIVLLRKEYESFSGKRATLSNTGAGKGASGSFNDLAEAVLRPVLLLSPYWKHRRLESVIRSVLYAKSNKKRRNSKTANRRKIIEK